MVVDDISSIEAILAAVAGLIAALTLVSKRLRAFAVSVIGLHRFIAKLGATPSSASDQWDCTDIDDGLYWKWSEPVQPKLLVVFVHGLFGNPKKSWGTLAPLLRTYMKDLSSGGEERLEAVPFDALAIRYPASIFQRASLGQGAELVREIFQSGYRQYDHLLFVTHSAGGLVLKMALCREMEGLLLTLQDETGRIPVESLRRTNIALRGRQVINFAVPHTGGRLPVSILLFPAYAIVTAAMIFAWIPAQLNRQRYRGFNFGFNSIPWELRNRRFRHERDVLELLEQRYSRLTKELDRLCLPRPQMIEVSGRDDLIIETLSTDVDVESGTKDRSGRTYAAAYTFRGTHPSLKNARHAHDPVVQFLASYLERYRTPADVAVAVETIYRSLAEEGGQTLVGSQKSEQGESWSIHGAIRGRIGLLQADAVRALHIHTEPRLQARPSFTVLTGDVGTGKTVALDIFARRLAINFLNNPQGYDPLPVMVPMQLLRVGDSNRLDCAILESWSALARERYLNVPSATLQWLTRRIDANLGTILIFDAIDEFLLYNRHITAELLLAAFGQLLDFVRPARRTQIVFGVRWGEPIETGLSEVAQLTVELRRLSLLEAAEHFPAATSALASVLAAAVGQELALARSSEVRERLYQIARSELARRPHDGSPATLDGEDGTQRIVELIREDGELRLDMRALSVARTPLVLNEMSRSSTGARGLEDDLRFEYPHEVLDLALDANLRKAGLLQVPEGSDWARTDTLMLSLGILAMAFTTYHRVELTDDEIERGIADVGRAWQRYKWHPDNRAQQWLLGTSLNFISDGKNRHRILSKTVFFPLGNAWRFKHRDWHDLNMARYYAFAVAHGHLTEMSRSTATNRAHRYAAEMLRSQGQFCISRRMVDRITGVVGTKSGRFVVGHLGALVAKSAIPFEPDALARLFSRCEEKMPAAERFILISALSYRYLRRHLDGDVSANEIEEVLLPRLEEGLCITMREKKARHPIDLVTGSLAFCVFQAIGKLGHHSRLGEVKLNLSDEEEIELIDGFMNERHNGEFIRKEDLSPMYYGIQSNFLNVQLEEARFQFRPITLVHYLYTLCVAYRHGAASDEVERRLPAILDDGSALGKALIKIDGPEGSAVRTVFECCGQRYRSRVAAGQGGN